MELSISVIIGIITVIISIGAFSNVRLKQDLIFYGPAISVRRQWYRLWTHGLIHGDVAHLIFNMIALFSFGTSTEKAFSSNCVFGNMGPLMFLILYLTALPAASIPDLIKHKDDYHFQSLGASGAISAVMFASIVLLPNSKIGLIFLPVQVPAYIFAVLYLGISYYLDKRGNSNINHGAHLWGAVYGLLFTIAFVLAMGKLDLIDNFKQQLNSEFGIIWYGCD
jgi:membrane associated rhomboid family serine protease